MSIIQYNSQLTMSSILVWLWSDFSRWKLLSVIGIEILCELWRMRFVIQKSSVTGTHIKKKHQNTTTTTERNNNNKIVIQLKVRITFVVKFLVYQLFPKMQVKANKFVSSWIANGSELLTQLNHSFPASLVKLTLAYKMFYYCSNVYTEQWFTFYERIKRQFE